MLPHGHAQSHLRILLSRTGRRVSPLHRPLLRAGSLSMGEHPRRRGMHDGAQSPEGGGERTSKDRI